jgi:CheY-like chemotaxis protein
MVVDLGRPLIVVVEDEMLVSMLASDILQELGCDVLETQTGKACLDLFAQKQVTPAAVMIDLGLPDMPGQTLIGELRQASAPLKIIVASGRSASELEGTFAADEHLTVIGKPYTHDDVKRALVKLGILG